MTTPALEISKLTKSYGKNEVLNDINISVKPGESFGLIGLNGIGKTTLIKSMVGLSQASSGNINIFGLEQNEKNHTEIAKKFSYLPEKFYPPVYLKGKEFLKIFLDFFGVKFNRAEADFFAESLDLDPKALDLLISKYSKGMSQKLGLIGSFMARVPLLILDEPMSGLDPKARIKLKKQLRLAKDQGTTIFFSSHILADIDEICDRIAIINNKKVEFIGPGADLRKKYPGESLEQIFLNIVG